MRHLKEQGRKINPFFSIGYSTCHWCHVMEHESFEKEEIAAILNQNFISIKVDREERPDIDSVYMAVCQTLTGSGGWPMSIFMTAEQQLAYMSHLAEGYPAGYCMFLAALLLYDYPPQKITAILSKTDTEEEIISYLPLYADIKILKEETPEFKLLNGKTTYYVCKDHICLPPVNEIK